ncbi:MAG: DUF1599 domain-containing protein [Lachnospiraceae bacterium]|nr:DUF1599 domain-containing protein [Lachnospiraceae bacterium]
MEEIAKYDVSVMCEATNNEPANVIRFRQIVQEMADTYKSKNADYGNSFSNTVAKYGVGTALARIDDKLSRATNLLLKGNQQVNDEAVTDTLKDLATYSVMLLMEIENKHNINL